MKKTSNFIQRSLTGILFVASLVGCIYWNIYTFAFLMLTVTFLAMMEYYKISTTNKIQPQKALGIVIGILFFVTNTLVATGIIGQFVLVFIIPFLMSIFVIELFRKKEDPFTNIAHTILGIIYTAVPLSLVNYFVISTDIDHNIIYKPQVLLGFFFLIWTNDTGAYIVGVSIGKNRLFPRISPKKSWEGSIGGLIFSIGIANVISLFYTDLSQLSWIIMSIIIVVMGSFGDLIESLFKRSANIKDSGNILPGHGGILDRFDSMIYASPAIFIFLIILKHFFN